MGTWKTRGLRGSTLEDMINMTNESYREKGLALIQKSTYSNTPLTLIKVQGILPLLILTNKVR